MSWDPVALLLQMRRNAARKYHSYKKKDLVERVLQLEAALYPFAYTLGAVRTEQESTLTSHFFNGPCNLGGGQQLHPDQQLLAVRQGCYSCGSISVGDVDNAVKVIGPEWL